MGSLTIKYPFKRKKVNGFGHYKLFQAVKLHFSDSSKFDLLKYGGQVNIKRESYDKKKGHRNLYERLAIKYDTWQLYRLYVSAASQNKLGSYPGNVLDNGAEEILNNFESVLSNVDYHFENSVESAARFCIENDCGIRGFLNTKPYCPLIAEFISGELNPLVFVIWDSLFKITERIDDDDLAVTHIVSNVDNLMSLVELDKKHFSVILKDVWKSNDLIQSN